MLGEISIIFTILISIIFVQLILTRSCSLFRRYFWMDEIVTDSLVRDESVRHSIAAIVGGLDTNPPTYHLIARAFLRLTCRSGEVALRSLALLAALAALLGIYLDLRRVYPPPIAFVAVLAVWAHPLFQLYAFEARMYGAWLAALAWFSYSLGLSWADSGATLALSLLAFTSVFLCMVHSFGIISFIIIFGCHTLSNGVGPDRYLPAAIASLGVLTFLAWSPFFWRQNWAYPVEPYALVPAWCKMRPRTVSFISPIFPGFLAAVFVGAGLSPSFLAIYDPALFPGRLCGDPATLAGLAGLVFQPLVILALCLYSKVFSQTRYALPAVACLAPAVGAVLARTPDLGVVVVCALLLMCSAYSLWRMARDYRHRDQGSRNLIAAIREHTAGDPVLFECIHDLYVVCHYAPDLAIRCFAVDFEPGQLGYLDHPFRVGSRDQARIFTHYYPIPNMLGLDSARSLEKKYIILFDPDNVRAKYGLNTRYLRYRLECVTSSIYELINN